MLSKTPILTVSAARFCGVLGLAGLLFGAPAAQADTIVQTQAFGASATHTAPDIISGGPPNASDDDTLTFAKYDGPGVLTSVLITFLSEYSGLSTVNILNGGGLFTTSGLGTMTLSSLLTSPVAQLIDGASAACSGNPTCFGSTPVGGAFNGSLTPIAFGDFAGLGTFDIDVDLVSQVTSGFTFSPFAFAHYAHSWEGEVTVTFEVAVPEPGTLAVLGLGLAGLGAMRRRRAG